MGYHTREFEKGVYGEFSKVEEEWEELLDARLQDGKILELCELADLYGAIDGYVKAKYNLTIEDVAVMSRMTSSAFEEGKRVSTATVLADEADVSYADTSCVNCGCDESMPDVSVSVRDDGKPHCQYCWWGNKR